MEGGRLLDQGTYGCVFDPPLLCKDAYHRRLQKAKQARGRYVGKITQAIDIRSEVTAAKHLASVPNYTQYYALPDPASVCIPAPLDEQPQSADIDKCVAIHRYGSQGMNHFIMPYGGITIRKLEPTLKTAGTSFSLDTFIKHILEACALMTLHGIVHYDLHSDNFIIDEKTKVPRLIDFGMSFIVSELDSEVLRDRWKQYSPDSHEPPEIIAINGIRHYLSTRQVFTDMLRLNKYARYVSQLLGTPKDTLLAQLLRFWKRSGTVKGQKWEQFFRYYWPVFDSWGLGTILIGIYRRWQFSPELQSNSDWKKVSDPLKQLLKGLLQFDPTERFDCVEALQMYDPENAILQSGSGKAWLEARLKVRGALSADAGETAREPRLQFS
jgi:serine/threonine protein kinase